MALKRSFLGIVFSLLCGIQIAAAAQMVPAGNRNTGQPEIPGGSKARTQAAKTTFDGKYDKVMQLLRNDTQLRSKIRDTSARYGISPIHMFGAIVGEHTYNVDVYDRLQTYYVKAASYLSSNFGFAYDGEKVDVFLARPQFETCARFKESYALWACRESVWDKSFRGKRVENKSFPNNRFSAVFFQPFYAGQTFGIGQLNPLTALYMSDYVNRTSGYPKLDINNPHGVYEAIIDPDMSLAYIAAVIRKSIDAYAKIADMDISNNPGITATLYNVGGAEARASQLAGENRIRRQKGQPVKWPEENYYGWLVNDRIKDLENLAAGT